MTPIEFAMLGCGLLALGVLSIVLWLVVNEVDALKVRVTVNEHVTGELVAQRVHEVTTQSCRRLNEVGRS